MILSKLFGFILVTILGIIALAFLLIYNIYKKFLMEHSISIKKIKEINEKYSFNEVSTQYYEEYFDNKIYYEKLRPKDLLIYNLVKDKLIIKENISKVIENINKNDFYSSDIKRIKNIGEYDIEKKFIFKKLLLKIESKIFNSLKLNPIVSYTIKAKIYLTNINGEKLKSYCGFYDIVDIEELLEKIDDKTNNRYNDKEIWNSICKIERAKVTNKLRFYIYYRDGYRCCRCGKKTDNLEIDHIVPISKGGKTHPDNLQTLCKKCNKEKSNIIESGTTLFNDKVNRVCPECGAPLKKVYGKYGVFYGCMNYPKCKYTEE